LITKRANLGINIICFSSTGKQRKAFELNLGGPTLQRLLKEHPTIQGVLEMLCVSVTSNDMEEAFECYRQLTMAYAAMLQWRNGRPSAPASSTAGTSDEESDGEPDDEVDEALAEREELLQQPMPVTPAPCSRKGARKAGVQQGTGGATTSMGSHAAGAEVEQAGEQPAAAAATTSEVQEGEVPTTSGQGAATAGTAAPTTVTAGTTASEPQQQQEEATGVTKQVRQKQHGS
jgi:hypothetical protein